MDFKDIYNGILLFLPKCNWRDTIKTVMRFGREHEKTPQGTFEIHTIKKVWFFLHRKQFKHMNQGVSVLRMRGG